MRTTWAPRRAQHLVEGTDELRIAVTDDERDGPPLVFQGARHVKGLLGDPRLDRVSCHADQEDLPALEV